MKNTNLKKILFDLVLVVLLVMVYSVSATGLIFHEIAGLVIFALFGVHLFYNRRWIVQAGKRIFDKNFSSRQRLLYVVDLLLLVSFLVCRVSGVLISKVLFGLEGAMAWKAAHMLSAMLALVLTGVHLGLHWKMILHTLKTRFPMPVAARRILAGGLLALVMVSGVYGLNTLAAEKAEHQKMRQQYMAGGVQTEAPAETSGVMAAAGPSGEILAADMAGNSGTGQGGAPGTGGGQKGPAGRMVFNPSSTVISSAAYLAVLTAVSVVLYAIDSLSGRRKRKGGRTPTALAACGKA
ncbi:DUF4405 domain-containing protein [Breznakiella homolactica]|uniref:DUF4405 domain-containing protein n=1 Tax=Breznakiella homolactica TaxID=2798577 RepID=A0A7T8B8Y3_9SPIR|nr:DUF4405 domain-containing protein [Breznakiella homolactica]QQO07877.1 DUF4405 domain-containing protein [Breznakiella homolactica]